MRWPFRRSAAPRPSEPGRDWASLPALDATVDLTAPALAPVLRLPDVSGTRPLPDRTELIGAPSAPRGRVTGLARLRRTALVHRPKAHPAEIDQEPDFELPEPEVVPTAVRRRVAAVAHRPVAQRPVLTEAVDDYVGEAREPLVPHRTTELDRLFHQQEAIGGGSSEMLALALAGFSSTVAEPPPRPDDPAPVTPPPPTERTRRRATLAQSRRMGLAPRSTPPVETADEPEPPPDPAPASTEVVADDSVATSPAVVDEPAPRRLGLGAPLANPPRRESVVAPPEVTSAFRSAFGVDVETVPVHRGPAVSEQARSASARAFTQQAEVYLPDEAGRLDEPETKALLAHEFVHAVQQRELGTHLPPEDSPAGAALEAEATATENWFLGTAPAPTTLTRRPPASTAPATHPSASTTPAARPPAPTIPADRLPAPIAPAAHLPAPVAPIHGTPAPITPAHGAPRSITPTHGTPAPIPLAHRPLAPTTPSPAPLALAAPAVQPQRAAEPEPFAAPLPTLPGAVQPRPTALVHRPAPTTVLPQPVAEPDQPATLLHRPQRAPETDSIVPPPLSQAVPVWQPPFPHPTPEPNPTRPGVRWQLPAPPPQDDSEMARLRETVAELADRVTTMDGRRPEPPTPRELDDLAHRLYRRIRGNLRRELLVDRERAGRLADLR